MGISCSRYSVPYNVLILLMYAEEGFYSKPSHDLPRTGEITLLDLVSMVAVFLMHRTSASTLCLYSTRLVLGAYWRSAYLNALLNWN